MAENKIVAGFDKIDWGEKFFVAVRMVWEVFAELGYGIKHKTFPLMVVLMLGILLGLAVLTKLDLFLLNLIDFDALRPESGVLYKIYGIGLITTGFWCWGLWNLALKRKLTKRLTNVFTSCGLKTVTGRLPEFIFDRPIDAESRKLRLKRSGNSVKKFKECRSELEGDLQIFIDEVRENRVGGTVDFIYSHHEMPDEVRFEHVDDVRKDCVVIGNTRANKLQVSLESIPHFLVGGQTGGGKSTFLRQLITTLYLRNKDTRFLLIDLKGGIEFQIFKDLPRIEVIDKAGEAIKKLGGIANILDDRIKTLNLNKVKDYVAFTQIEKRKRIYPDGVSKGRTSGRLVVVIDEVAELFLAGGPVNAEQSKHASEIVGRISRLGRAPGIHLVLGTQRPDKRALDTQIKANLPGKLCFQMSDTASSMVVINNARARDLPGIPGRAIWQNGLTMVEVQTPFLKVDEANELLSSYRSVEKTEQSKPQMPSCDFEERV